MSAKTKKRIKQLQIMLSIAVGVLLLFCVYLIHNQHVIKRANEKEKMSIRYELTHKEIEKNVKYVQNFNMRLKEDVLAHKLLKNCLSNLDKNGYDAVIISMWDNSNWDMEWFSKFIGIKVLNLNKCIKIPNDIGRILDYISKSNVTDVYLNIDPEKLYNNYLNSYQYRVYQIPYLQIMQSELWTYMEENNGIKFRFTMPIYYEDYWKLKDEEELETSKEIWNDFVMYTCRYNNEIINCMTFETDIISNRKNFKDTYRLTDEMTESTMISQIGLWDYVLPYDHFEVTWEKLFDEIVTE